MRSRLAYLLLCYTLYTFAGQPYYVVTWYVDLDKEAQKNKFSFAEVTEYLYHQARSSKSYFYADTLFKIKIDGQKLLDYLYQKNQSIAGYTRLWATEEWKLRDSLWISKVKALAYENPNLATNDLYKKIYVNPKFIPTILKEIKISGYYLDRALIPFGQWLKKHYFDYNITYTSYPLPNKPYKFFYDITIDSPEPKEIQFIFDFFPAKNVIFDRTYKRDKKIEQNFMHLPQYKHEDENEKFRTCLVEFLQKNKLLKYNSDIEEILQLPSNLIFYFNALKTKNALQWTSIRVYLTAGKAATVPQILCAYLNQNKVKSLSKYIKKKTGSELAEYFVKEKIDFLVSHINNSFAKDIEEGLFLKDYFLSSEF
ncbi:MAG: hypothetical protein NZ519_11895 [Bacteroidia bacterium]|nr:hypothetical protein [Bacteroidia bacterium]